MNAESTPVSATPSTIGPDLAAEAQARIAALYSLTGWRVLWTAKGPVWDSYIIGVTDGVIYRHVDAMGTVLCDRHVHDYCQGEARWRGRKLPEWNWMMNSMGTHGVPFHGPVRPTPSYQLHPDIPRPERGEDDNESDRPLPEPSCWYAPWGDVFAKAEEELSK